MVAPTCISNLTDNTHKVNMHPLAGDFAGIKDSELESKIGDLTRKYFMTHNTDVKTQIGMLLETYKMELGSRRQAALEQLAKNSEKSLDNLIKVN